MKRTPTMTAMMTLFALVVFQISVFAQDTPATTGSDEPPLAPVNSDPALEAKKEAEAARAEAAAVRAELEELKKQMKQNKGEPAAGATMDDGPEIVDYRDKPKPKGYHTHDGFFLRLNTGLGGGGYAASGKAKGPNLIKYVEDPEGGQAMFLLNVSLGGAVTENLIIHADLWGTPGSYTLHKSYADSVQSAGAGLGLTYYFDPNNVFLTLSAGPSVGGLLIADRDAMRDNDDDDHFDEDDIETEFLYGGGASITFGKEWWVRDNWGVGIAARGQYNYLRNEDIELHQGAGFLLFTATYD